MPAAQISSPQLMTEVLRQATAGGRLVTYRERRWGRAGDFKRWLDSAALPELTKEQAVALYRAAGGTQVGIFRGNSIEDIRDSLDFLLYDTIKLESRFDECVNDTGAYKLRGAGKEFVSCLLCLQEPDLFALWNSGLESLLQSLGLRLATLRRGHWGLRYLDLLEAAQQARHVLRLSDFQVLDEAACAWRQRKQL